MSLADVLRGEVRLHSEYQPVVSLETGQVLGYEALARDIDRALGFTIPARHARGRVVRLGPALDAILSAHAYPPAIEALLAEALTLCALMGSTLKDEAGQLTMQTRSDAGVVQLLVCDYRGGELRGYIQYDADRLAEAPE